MVAAARSLPARMRARSPRRFARGVTTDLRVIDALGSHKKGRKCMASSSKKKTTMAKINRENAVRERRLRKRARKEARKQASADPPATLSDAPSADDR